jgi:hypothetical protein
MTNEDVMTANRWFILALIGMAPAWSAPPLTAATAAGATGHGGYLVFNQFTVDADRHSVIVPPPDTRAGDLLWIRPLRLNSDEYLVVQKCSSADCATAEVERAWNAAGIMGWYPILSNKVRIEAGATYMIWMQRIPVKGGRAFSLYERDSPPLVFSPAGPAGLFADANLKEAQGSGPTPVASSSTEGPDFVATFAGGSVVRMEMLRADR